MTGSTQKRTLAFVARRAETTVAALRELAPLALGVTNLWLGGRRDREEREALAAGYREGAFQVAYVPAHDADAMLLSPEELVDEVQLNESAVHQLLGAPAPSRRVVILPSPIGPEAVAALERHGIDAVVLPKAPDQPCRLGERLMLLSGVTLIDELDGVRGELTLEEKMRPLTPPWLPRVEAAARPRQEHPGAAVAEILGWLCDGLGFQRVPRFNTGALFEHPLEQLPARVRVPLLLRLARAARGESWARQLLELLSLEVELGAQPRPAAELSAWAQAALPDPSLYQSLAQNGWRGRERWQRLFVTIRYGLTDSSMMRSIAIL
jgi:hypothetical protein